MHVCVCVRGNPVAVNGRSTYPVQIFNSVFLGLVFAALCDFAVLHVGTDHIVHYMDLRKPSEPVAEFKGHRKAVSYVHFINSQELVSA